ncbi:unnamed protein product [Arctogadus glacialis]
MTRAVLSILVIFVCLAPMLEVNSTQGGLKKRIEAVELYCNSFKEEYNAEMDALAEGIKEQNRLYATLPMLEQYSGPEFAAIKKILETQKESNTELNAKFLLITEVNDHKFQITQKKMEGIKDLVHETELNVRDRHLNPVCQQPDSSRQPKDPPVLILPPQCYPVLAKRQYHSNHHRITIFLPGSSADIRASPANRMTRAVLSILVMFVCLAPMLEVNSTMDDFKMVIEAVELYVNSLKEDDLEMVANSFIDEHIRITDNVLNIVQDIGPEYVVAKQLFEAVKEIIPELKAKWLKSPEDYKLFWEYIQKAIEGLKVLHETMTLLQFKQVDCEFSLTDIQASPANRMTRTVLSILVMFVCLAHTRETLDDFKMVIEAVELYVNSLKEDDLEMVANSFIDEHIRITDNVLNIVQDIGPEYVVAKQLFEAVKEIIPELKAKWLKSPEDYKLFWEYIQKAIEGLKVLHETMVIKDEL